jgi:hypothetical protein
MLSPDETELHRLCDLLASVDRLVPEAAPEREALQKAALALHLTFLKGFRGEVEQQFATLGLPLSGEQQSRLAQLGL